MFPNVISGREKDQFQPVGPNSKSDFERYDNAGE
jgi:hypothetical protein